MLPPRKIGIVSTLWTADMHRLTRGALSYADTHPRMVLREFHLTRDFGTSPEAATSLSALQKWNPDGLLCFLEQRELDHLRRLLARPRPIVSMCATRPMPGVAVVAGDFAVQAKVVVNHLQHQGLRSLAMLLLENVPNMQVNLINVFNRVAQPAKPKQSTFFHEVSPAVLDDAEADIAPIPRQLADWLRQLPKPSGVFCPQAGGGGYLIRVCQALGLDVPKDIRVVGSDDADVCLGCTPTLTSALCNGTQIGFEAMHVLEPMLQGAPAPADIVRIGAIDLHVRESSGRLRAEICDIAAALDHIDQQACHGLSVKQLVIKTQNVSVVTFHKHFFAATGKTPGAAILQRQLEEAQSLLARTELSMTLIADHCGFSGSSDFARRFRAETGVTPSDYRQQHLNDNRA